MNEHVFSALVLKKGTGKFHSLFNIWLSIEGEDKISSVTMISHFEANRGIELYGFCELKEPRSPSDYARLLLHKSNQQLQPDLQFTGNHIYLWQQVTKEAREIHNGRKNRQHDSNTV